MRNLSFKITFPSSLSGSISVYLRRASLSVLEFGYKDNSIHLDSKKKTQYNIFMDLCTIKPKIVNKQLLYNEYTNRLSLHIVKAMVFQ